MTKPQCFFLPDVGNVHHFRNRAHKAEQIGLATLC